MVYYIPHPYNNGSLYSPFTWVVKPLIYPKTTRVFFFHCSSAKKTPQGVLDARGTARHKDQCLSRGVSRCLSRKVRGKSLDEQMHLLNLLNGFSWTKFEIHILEATLFKVKIIQLSSQKQMALTSRYMRASLQTSLQLSQKVQPRNLYRTYLQCIDRLKLFQPNKFDTSRYQLPTPRQK